MRATTETWAQLHYTHVVVVIISKASCCTVRVYRFDCAERSHFTRQFRLSLLSVWMALVSHLWFILYTITVFFCVLFGLVHHLSSRIWTNNFFTIVDLVWSSVCGRHLHSQISGIFCILNGNELNTANRYLNVILVFSLLINDLGDYQGRDRERDRDRESVECENRVKTTICKRVVLEYKAYNTKELFSLLIIFFNLLFRAYWWRA